MFVLFLIFNLVIHILSFTEGDIYFVYLFLLFFIFLFFYQKKNILFEEEVLKDSKIFFFLELELLLQKLEVKKGFSSFILLMDFLRMQIRENFIIWKTKLQNYLFFQETLLLKKTFVEFLDHSKEVERRGLFKNMKDLYLKEIKKYL